MIAAADVNMSRGTMGPASRGSGNDAGFRGAPLRFARVIREHSANAASAKSTEGAPRDRDDPLQCHKNTPSTAVCIDCKQPETPTPPPACCRVGLAFTPWQVSGADDLRNARTEVALANPSSLSSIAREGSLAAPSAAPARLPVPPALQEVPQRPVAGSPPEVLLNPEKSRTVPGCVAGAAGTKKTRPGADTGSSLPGSPAVQNNGRAKPSSEPGRAVPGSEDAARVSEDVKPFEPAKSAGSPGGSMDASTVSPKQAIGVASLAEGEGQVSSLPQGDSSAGQKREAEPEPETFDVKQVSNRRDHLISSLRTAGRTRDFAANSTKAVSRSRAPLHNVVENRWGASPNREDTASDAAIGDDSQSNQDYQAAGPLSNVPQQSFPAAPPVPPVHTLAPPSAAPESLLLNLKHVDQRGPSATSPDATTPASAEMESAQVPFVPAVQSARLLDRIGHSEIHVGLTSRDFGTIDLRTSLSQDKVGANIATGHPNLRSAIQAEIPSLQQALEGHHLRLDAFDVSAQAGGRSGGHSSDQPPGSARKPQDGVAHRETGYMPNAPPEVSLSCSAPYSSGLSVIA